MLIMNVVENNYITVRPKFKSKYIKGGTSRYFELFFLGG